MVWRRWGTVDSGMADDGGSRILRRKKEGIPEEQKELRRTNKKDYYLDS